MLRIALAALCLNGLVVLAVPEPSDRVSMGHTPENAPGLLDRATASQGKAHAEGDKISAVEKAEHRIHDLDRRFDQSGLDRPLSLQSELGLLRGDVRNLQLTPIDRWRDVDQRITQKLDQLETRYIAE